MLQKPKSPLRAKKNRLPHGCESLHAADLRPVSEGTDERPFSQTDAVKADQYGQRKVGVKETETEKVHK